jgi:CRP-like cAMP-binding protein
VFEAENNMSDKHSGVNGLSRADLGPAARSQLIENTLWAQDFTAKQVELLATFMDAYEVTGGTIILREGGRGGHMVLIVRGTVAVIKEDSTRTPKVIATLGPGKTFGEMSLLDGAAPSATVVATTDATLLSLSRENLERLNDEAPRLGLQLLTKVACLMSQYLRQTSGRLIDYLGR